MTKKEFIATLAKHNYCRNESIKEMKISRQTFYNWVKKYDITLKSLNVLKTKGPSATTVAKNLRRERILREEAEEKRAYETALLEHDNNIARVALYFGLTPESVYKKLRKHGIEKPLPKHLLDRIRKDWSFMDDAIADYEPELTV